MAGKKTKTNTMPIPEGLEQTFRGADGKMYKLASVLSDGDWWETKGRAKMTLLTHEAVEKIAEIAGLHVIKYDINIEPTIYNNMTTVVTAEIQDKNGNKLQPEMGEASRDNLGSRGKAYPMAMAQKRAFDRTILKHLGIRGMLSEEELPQDNHIERIMEELTYDEQKIVAPLLTQLLMAKSKTALAHFSKNMPERKKELNLNDEQVSFIKKLYKTRLGELSKVNF